MKYWTELWLTTVWIILERLLRMLLVNAYTSTWFSALAWSSSESSAMYAPDRPTPALTQQHTSHNSCTIHNIQLWLYFYTRGAKPWVHGFLISWRPGLVVSSGDETGVELTPHPTQSRSLRRRWVSRFLNGTSAELGYTMPFTLVYVGK